METIENDELVEDIITAALASRAMVTKVTINGDSVEVFLVDYDKTEERTLKLERQKLLEATLEELQELLKAPIR